jgi:predicted cytidylate kinase
MIITISGVPGSGKSTVARILAQRLHLKHYSTGDFMREMARKRNISLEELGDLAKIDPSIDKELDERQIALGKEEDNFIIDGRLSYHFIPHSIKVFIDVDVEEGARRILKDSLSGLRKEEQAATLQEMVNAIKKRIAVEQERYRNYYGLNPYDKTQYDIVVDSTHISAEDVAEKIVHFINSSLFQGQTANEHHNS